MVGSFESTVPSSVQDQSSLQKLVPMDSACALIITPDLLVWDHTNRQQEAASGEINLAGDDPDTVARMLSYLYTTDYDDGSHRKTEGSDILMEDTEAQNEDEAEVAADEHTAPEVAPPDNDEAVPGEAAANGATVPSPPASENDSSEESADGADTDEESDIKSRVGSALQNNVLVYGIGEKYDIPGLKLLAKEYFSACAALHWPPDNLPEIIKLVYESTPENDRGLREVVTNLCLPHLDELMKSDSFRATTIELSSFCYDILRESSACSDQTIINLTIRLSNVESEKQVTERRLADAEKLVATLRSQLAQADNNITIIQEILAKYPDCRHCNNPLRWYIDGGFSQVPVVLKCRNCHTRHQFVGPTG